MRIPWTSQLAAVFYAVAILVLAAIASNGGGQ